MITGGAVAEYGRQATRNMKEFETKDTLKKRWDGSPLDLVCEILVSFYSNKANLDVLHVLLREDNVAIGSSLVKSKKYVSLFQILYIIEKPKSEVTVANQS